ncbi:hypothetical protein P7C73_g3095, partial [Tremellales sp. Uapishka_1]
MSLEKPLFRLSKTLSRSFATALLPASTFSPHHFASPFASTSKLTLDRIPFLTHDQDALSFAADEDLINVLLSKPTWTQSIDPAAAYECLRKRQTFSLYLRHLSSSFQIDTIYHSLKPSGLNERLISDLLIHNPDARVLRQLVEFDSQLPSSLLASIYKRLVGPLADGAIFPLSRITNKKILKALLAEGDDVDAALVLRVYHDLLNTHSWDNQGTWLHLEAILHLLKRSEVDKDVPLRLVKHLLNIGSIPKSSLGKSDPEHPRASTLLVQSVVLRCCLQWNYLERSIAVTQDLVSTLISSGNYSASTIDLVYQALSTSLRLPISNFALVERIGTMLLNLSPHIRLPTSLLEAYYDQLAPAQALVFYASLPTTQASPSPHHLLSFAQQRPDKGQWRRLIKDVTHDPSFISQRSAFLVLLSNGSKHKDTIRLYDLWRSNLTITPDLVPCLVRSLQIKRCNPLIRARNLVQEADHLVANLDYEQDAKRGQLATAIVSLLMGKEMEGRRLLYALKRDAEWMEPRNGSGMEEKQRIEKERIEEVVAGFSGDVRLAPVYLDKVAETLGVDLQDRMRMGGL